MPGGSEPVAAAGGRVPSSFRDPAGFVIARGDEILRVVQPAYRPDYERLQASGLYERLVAEKLLVAHEEISAPELGGWKVLRPQRVPFISYPYEWCFSQWRDAALTTLRLQELALEHGMTLKDASAFNVQFLEGAPILIDSLSFAALGTPRPWDAYGQFCRHFLAPLALMSYREARLGRLMQLHLDGVPLGLAARLLPARSRLNLWLHVHLHWHATSERRDHTAPAARRSARPYAMNSLRGLVTTLRSAVQRLRPPRPGREWATYYGETVIGGGYVEHKQQVVGEWLRALSPRLAWDLGANTGLFSRLAAAAGAYTISFDGDLDCVELNYRATRQAGEKSLLPLFLDLTNPTPALGWQLRERSDWRGRGQPDAVLALALIHHLAIGNNVPLPELAEFFAGLGPRLVIEFVPKDDPNAQKLLTVREDIFGQYTQAEFERAFERWFRLERRAAMRHCHRVLYSMVRR